MEPLCYRCGSLKHTTQEHMERLAEGRRKSKKWHDAVALANRITKTGKSITFRDPVGRIQKLKERLNSPETKVRLSESKKLVWAGRSDERRKEIADKISAAQTGREFTPEHLANLRKANAKPRTAEHRRQLALARLGKTPWNKGLTKDTNLSVLSTSEKQKGRIPDFDTYRTPYEGPKGFILMRSSWEVAYAKYLDREGRDWKFEPRVFVVGCGLWTGETYTPDFYLPDENKYVEIKGRMTEGNRLKLERFRKIYANVNFEILKIKDLQSLGLLDIHGYPILNE